MRKNFFSNDKRTRTHPCRTERSFFMKKWIAPVLVLAFTVLLILWGKGITEKILKNHTDKNTRALKSPRQEILLYETICMENPINLYF